MQNFKDTFETPERSFISGFSICMTVPLLNNTKVSNVLSDCMNNCCWMKDWKY